MCGNAPCERFNCTMMALFKSLSKEQKDNWLLHLPSLIFVYNATPHGMTRYQPYALMSGLGWQITMIIIHRASVIGLNNMSSSLP